MSKKGLTFVHFIQNIDKTRCYFSILAQDMGDRDTYEIISYPQDPLRMLNHVRYLPMEDQRFSLKTESEELHGMLDPSQIVRVFRFETEIIIQYTQLIIKKSFDEDTHIEVLCPPKYMRQIEMKPFTHECIAIAFVEQIDEIDTVQLYTYTAER